MSRWLLNTSKGKDYNFSEEPASVLSQSHSTNVFADVQRKQFVSIASGPSTRHHRKELGSVLFALCVQAFA